MTDRVVLVTGAASGIGHATAASFLAEGATVVGLDLRPDVPDGVGYVECDVTSTASVDAAVATAVIDHGRVDVVVNVAGIIQLGHVDAITDDEWRRVLDVDLTGPFRVIRAALPYLRVTQGAIVNVASIAGLKGQAYTAAYCAAKGGLVLLTKALAVELASAGIRVNCVCPAGVETPLVLDASRRIPKDADSKLLGRLNLLLPHFFVQPDEVAAAVCWLASDAARSITGIAVPIDGGVDS